MASIRVESRFSGALQMTRNPRTGGDFARGADAVAPFTRPTHMQRFFGQSRRLPDTRTASEFQLT
jgi:hypothetical protein